MAEPTRRPVPGAWLRAVARKMKAWAESVLSEEESDFAAALAQARVSLDAPRADASPDGAEVARVPAAPATVTAPAVGLGAPEHWLRDIQARRTGGPPADWVARVRKVAPHLVEGLPEAEAPLPVSDAHLSFRARMLLSASSSAAPSSASAPSLAPPPRRDAARPSAGPERVSHRPAAQAPSEKGPSASARGEGGSETPGRQGPVGVPREAPRHASKVSPLSMPNPFAAPSPPTPVPMDAGRLLAEVAITPTPSLMHGGPAFANPVMVASTPASPSEVCVPPLREEDRERNLCASGYPQGISASQALGLQGAPVKAAPPAPRRATPRFTGEPWGPRRRQAELQEEARPAVQRDVSLERTPPFAPRTWTEAEEDGRRGASAREQEEASTARFATPVREEPPGAPEESATADAASWPELPSALAPESPDVAQELRLWTRLRRLEREQRGE
ncbi:hypothetical protein [Myxococcus sp. CA039A]|uniref:hypothetical protein n=1 Tax=Myxococcus sp. CA039A TaxID=2741737 RepID=UPI00157B43DA|nr:hypothetical protein [Myxococcus sp. CA039A]NTX56451.1 hypothetical protein [Myxococcus sp. CA039A]